MDQNPHEPPVPRVAGHLPPAGESVDSPRATPSAAGAPAVGNEPPATSFVTTPHSFSLSWRQIALVFWLLLSGLAIVRLVSSFIRGFRMIQGSSRVDDAGLLQAASRALSRLGLAATRTSHFSALALSFGLVLGPQPILLVPARVFPTAEKAIDWVAVFCHELAHWRRLDHLASLAGEVLVCVLPWNPLAWWARTRLGQLAELACDDWVLACGSQGTDYAASLLELVPQRGASPALAAVSSRSGLVGRMKHILDERRSSPTIGRGWALLALAFTLLASSALALAQAGSASSREQKTENAVSSPANEPAPNGACGDETHCPCHGSGP